MAGGHHVEPLDGVGLVAGAEFVEVVGGVGELGEELGGDFGADFVAAAADAGADGGEEVGGLVLKCICIWPMVLAAMRARVPRQPAWMAATARFLGSTRRMGTQSAVWMARRRLGGLVMRGVALADFGRGGVEKMDDIGVELFQGDEVEICGAERRIGSGGGFPGCFRRCPNR